MADIQAGNAVSTDNSTESTLGISGVFTGTSEEVSEYATVSVGVFANVASATDGLSIQFSPNGTNWDHTDVFTIPASTGKTFTVGPAARFFRIVYTNGVLAQTTFRLQTVFKVGAPKPSSHRIQDTISNDDDAELGKSVITGEDSNGIFQNISANSDGSLNTVPTVPDTPSGSTEVIREEFSDISTTSGTDNVYTITNGTTLTITAFAAGAEDETGGSVIELFDDPNGDLSVLNRISTLFTNGTSMQIIIAEDFDGDGTRRIVLRRRGYTANAREIFAQWRGFET